ncbi:MAG: GGDEF domain-containing protein [Bacillota bacterium]
MDLIHLLIGLELLGVNLYVSYLCLTPKYNTRTSLRVFVVFTIGIVLISLGLRNLINDAEIGRGYYIVIGLFYIYPIYSIFKESLKKTLLVIGLAYLYSLIIFGLAYSFTLMINYEHTERMILAFQTLLILVTIYWYRFIIKERVLYIVTNLEKSVLNRILWLTIFWLVTLVIFQLQIKYFDALWLAFTLYILIATCIVISYLMFYSLVEINDKAKSLDKKTKQDALTGLKNRDMLLLEGNDMINKQQPFTLIFIDLDYFKLVNDTYGHTVGDHYLQLFVEAVIALTGSDSTFYRLSGDEFVYISLDNDTICKYCEKFNDLAFPSEYIEPAFLGLSLGCATYPKDGETLSDILHTADTKMYQIKKEKHRFAPKKLDN